jgi:hypothetical protein
MLLRGVPFMLDAVITLVTGFKDDSRSGGGSSGGLGECDLIMGGWVCGLMAESGSGLGSREFSRSVGGAGGNLKFCCNTPGDLLDPDVRCE